ncbi:protein-glutamate methylesterase/protein-glutamine glutaminase [Calorimonas adulescens]|uniref:Protein-glutamate methylesterase/protein-glutamine glutaminase n=1 Tax=Calorimonas adulescens TaxID=2606906 RepID=A0A5D8QIG4_9THEO|nr:chemotaxis response regulator protein-glutamate methylesterase [Calorimonas adulescens]TZE83333.1 chemotaxis response regulator protein-glutamate methylesterase [Calorimonas adulescens]
MSTSKVKVMVVDDSAFMRKFVSDIVNSSEDMYVIDTAVNGLEAVSKVVDRRPDVVLMDVEMPIMDGLTAVKKIMEVRPTPIIMLSALTKEGAETTLKALELGAIDFVLKPSNFIYFKTQNIDQLLIEKILMASKTNLFNLSPVSRVDHLHKATQTMNLKDNLKNLVAIGVSTGGPKALQYVVPQLPADLPSAVLIVQHMPAGFTRSLANRLNEISNMLVKEAEDGENINPGTVYIAPGGYHMKVYAKDRKYFIGLSNEPPVKGLKPCFDILLSSLSKIDLKIIAVIMTGMGNDGTKGLIELRDREVYMIAQNEKTSTIYGMPKSAIETGLIDEVLPLDRIAEKIEKIARGF